MAFDPIRRLAEAGTAIEQLSDRQQVALSSLSEAEVGPMLRATNIRLAGLAALLLMLVPASVVAPATAGSPTTVQAGAERVVPQDGSWCPSC